MVTDAAQVTDNPDATRAHSSPQMAVNPTNGELVVVEPDIRGDHRCNVHISTDKGRTWSEGGDPMQEPFTECSRVVINGPYATATFDENGTLYVAFRASDPKWSNPHPPPSIPRHVFLARSTDGGRNFETTMVYEGPKEAAEAAGDLPVEGHNNRAMVAVDPSDPSNVYVSWYQVGFYSDKKSHSWVAASDDGGQSFGDPVEISDDRGGRQPRLAVGPEGTLHAAYNAGTFDLPDAESPHPEPLIYRQSTDQGESWTDHREIDAGTGNNRKWTIAAAPNAAPNSDEVYVAWYGNPDTAERGPEVDWHVYLRASRDGGESWSDRVVVNEELDSADGIKRYDPGLSVAPNGRVDVAWYDFRNSPEPEGLDHNDFNAGGMQDVYYTWSTDQGRSFRKPDVRVTDRIIDRHIGVWSNNIHSHTNVGLVSTDEAAFVAWQDTRNGDQEHGSEDVYFASVGLDGRAPPSIPLPSARLPWWVTGLTGIALGLGLAMLVSWLIARKGGRSA